MGSGEIIILFVSYHFNPHLLSIYLRVYLNLEGWGSKYAPSRINMALADSLCSVLTYKIHKLVNCKLVKAHQKHLWGKETGRRVMKYVKMCSYVIVWKNGRSVLQLGSFQRHYADKTVRPPASFYSIGFGSLKVYGSHNCLLKVFLMPLFATV